MDLLPPQPNVSVPIVVVFHKRSHLVVNSDASDFDSYGDSYYHSRCGYGRGDRGVQRHRPRYCVVVKIHCLPIVRMIYDVSIDSSPGTVVDCIDTDVVEDYALAVVGMDTDDHSWSSIAVVIVTIMMDIPPHNNLAVGSWMGGKIFWKIERYCHTIVVVFRGGEDSK